MSLGSSPLMSLLFLVENAAVLPFWLAMMLAPQAPLTRRLLQPALICVPFALAYLLLFVTQLGALGEIARSPSFDAIRHMLGTPAGANVAWLHYLTGDLFVGRWIFWDSRARALPRWLMTLVFLLGLTFCPLALLLYLCTRGNTPQPLEASHG